MTLEATDGEYRVRWIEHMDISLDAKVWCYETFGLGWGEHMIVRGPGINDIAVHSFNFKRLYHAQWFMAKWAA